jgi:thiol-disulfide isomerase/thioredoxin
MWLWCVSMAFAGTNPIIHIQWKGDQGSLRVAAPAGEHFAADAPAELDVKWTERSLNLEGVNLELGAPLSVSGIAGDHLEIGLSCSVCTDDPNQCRRLEAALSLDLPDSKKGRWSGEMNDPVSKQPSMSESVRGDGAARLERALEVAAENDSLVFLDFSAVWCPPCNQLAAELLHQDPLPAPLDQMAVAVIDVDDPSVWSLKDRYQVGRYPTLIIADAKGEEMGRLVGYPGREDFLAWAQHVSGDQGDLSPAARAARDAWSRRGDGPEAIEALLETAQSEPDNYYFRGARLSVKPNKADVEWLLTEAPSRVATWLPGLSSWLYETDPALAHRAVQTGLKYAPASAQADLLSVAAAMAEGDVRRELYRAAAAVLSAQFSGNPDEDRANYTWYAWLLEQAGDPDGAVDFLREAQGIFPDEPTFFMSSARVLLSAERLEEALVTSQRAVETAWGDNLLRAVALHGKILISRGREAEMRTLVEETLAAEGPAEGLSVRTHRYREALEEMLAAVASDE